MTFIELVETSGEVRSRHNQHLAALLILYVGVIVLSAARFAGWPFPGWRGPLVDFNDFFLAGVVAADGHVERAYRFVELVAEQQSLFGQTSLMPWTYPPQFDLLMAALSRLPIAGAYALFIGPTFVVYALTISRLAPGKLASVLLLIAPAIVVTARCGQNGFLTGSLVGWTAIGLLEGRARAGIPLGLMVVKPHLAIAMALHVVMSRRWNVALTAALVVAVTSALATFAFGLGVWSEFLGAVKEAGGFLVEGLYPHFRMISGYATARSLGLSASVATLVQFAFASVSLSATALAVVRFNPRQAIGIAAIASVMISPYAYDYDLPVFGVGLAMLLGDLSRHGAPRERFALYAFVLGVQFVDFAIAVRGDFFDPHGPLQVSLGCLPVIATLAVVWRILERARRRAKGEVEAPKEDHHAGEICAI